MATLVELVSAPGAGAVAVEEVQSRKGGGNLSDGSAYEERIYAMQFSDTTWDSLDARNASGVPAYGAQLGSSSLYLMEKEVEPDANDQTIVRCRVTFSTLSQTKMQPNFGSENVWSITKTISSQQKEIRVDADITGAILVNPFNETFKPPITELAYDARVQNNFLTNSSAIWNEITPTLGHVNNATIGMAVGVVQFIFDVGELFFQDFTAQGIWDQDGNAITQFQYDLLWRPNSDLGTGDAWHEDRPFLSLLKRMNTSLPPSGDNTTPILNSTVNNDFTTEPRFLDSNGDLLPNGSTNVCYITAVTKATASFDSLLSGLA